MDLKKLVSDSLKEAMRGTVGEPMENAAAHVTEALNGLKIWEDGIIEGMTVEVHEEPDDVKLIREVMEEPLETLHATITVRMPAALKMVRLEVPGRGTPEDGPLVSSDDGQRPELDHEPCDK